MYLHTQRDTHMAEASYSLCHVCAMLCRSSLQRDIVMDSLIHVYTYLHVYTVKGIKHCRCPSSVCRSVCPYSSITVHFRAMVTTEHYIGIPALLQLNGALATPHKRHVVSGTSRHVIPRRSLGPRLLLTWTTTLIIATSPFIWFHMVSDWTSSTCRRVPCGL